MDEQRAYASREACIAALSMACQRGQIESGSVLLEGAIALIMLSAQCLQMEVLIQQSEAQGVKHLTGFQRVLGLLEEELDRQTASTETVLSAVVIERGSDARH